MNNELPSQPDPQHEHVRESRERQDGLLHVSEGMEDVLDAMQERSELPLALLTAKRAIVDFEARKSQGETIDEAKLVELKLIAEREQKALSERTSSEDTRP